jgi:hypothetical protein
MGGGAGTADGNGAAVARGSLTRRFQREDTRFEAGEAFGHGLATGLPKLTDSRLDPADAPVQADGEHGADDAGNGNDHRRQHEDRDQALQDRIPRLEPDP